MLRRVTELVVRVVRIAGVAVIRRSKSGILSGTFGELIFVSDAGAHSEHWPVIV